MSSASATVADARAGLSAVDAASLTVWAEARNQPLAGQVGVAQVIRRRVTLGRWGDTVSDVVFAPKQFSCWNPGPDPNHRRLLALVDRVLADQAVPELRQARWIVTGVLRGDLDDVTGGADHYLTREVYAKASSRHWAKHPRSRITATIEDHVFLVVP